MLNEIRGNVWDLANKNSMICILTNNTVTSTYQKDNQISRVFNPMYGGIALEALLRNTGLDVHHALCIGSNEYFLGFDSKSKCGLIRFPTKYNIGDNKSSLELIEQSLQTLVQIANNFKSKKIYLPRPGCGIGGLDWETEVKPLCEKYLEDLENVFIVTV